MADDDRTMRRGLRVQLEAAADLHLVGEVSSGQGPVTSARREHVNVGLIDLHMRVSGSIDAIRELSQATDQSPVAVIAMTNHARDYYVSGELNDGATALLLKRDGARSPHRDNSCRRRPRSVWPMMANTRRWTGSPCASFRPFE